MAAAREFVPAGNIANRNRVAEFFGKSLITVDTWIRQGCPVLSKGGRGVGYEFDLRAVAEWVYGRGRGHNTGGQDFDPDTLTPKERLDWYNGEKAKRFIQVRDGELVEAHEVVLTGSETIKAFISTLETLPDILERDCGLSPESLDHVQNILDRERDKLYQRLVG